MRFSSPLLWKILSVASLLALFSMSVCGQTVSSSLEGTVTDPSGGSLAQADVRLTDQATGVARTTKSNDFGIFRFTNLLPSTYSISVSAAGFKTYVAKDIVLASSTTRGLGPLKLELGAVTDQVTVTAQATPVQTASGEKGALVDGNQLLRLALKGRDVMQLLNLVPGVSSPYAGEAPSENALANVSINGSTMGKVGVTVDGLLDVDTGANASTHVMPNMDSVAEIRVMTANYQAEFGRMSGGAISMVTKSGSQQFHGTGWATKRHEMFNANSFFNNFNGYPKPIYRYFIGGYSIGGPVYIPGLFNTAKTKVFFFASQEYTRQKPGTVTITGLAPTALERQGDFSKSLDSTGRLIPLFDPTTRKPIPGNLIPLNSGSQTGIAMLNFFPMPNRCDLNNNAEGCYTETDATQINRRNYRASKTLEHPRRNDIVRIDANPTSKLNTWFRYMRDYDLEQANAGISLLTAKNTWEPYYEDHPNPGHNYGFSATYTLSPNLVNEATIGKSYNAWDYFPHDPSQLDRNRMKDPPHWFDSNSPDFKNDGNLNRPYLSPGNVNFANWVPAVTGGTMTAPASGARPGANYNDIYTFNDTVSWFRGAHSLKAGFYYERTGKVEQHGTGTYLGSYDFSSSSSFPQDTGYGNANMFLGNFNSYSEGMRKISNYWFSDIEAFLQDSWRVNRRFTLELGVRFYHMTPLQNLNNISSSFWPSSYDPKKAGRLYQPGCTVVTAGACPTANRVALDPVTGYTALPNLVNTFVPASVGGYASTPDFFTGMIVADGSNPNVPRWGYSQPALAPAFRTGFAWDVFGNGKTAVRGGFGQFLQNTSDYRMGVPFGAPPVAYNRVIYNADFASVLSRGSSAAIAPVSSNGVIGPQNYPSSMSASFGVQQSVGFGTVVEASYVGAFRRHDIQARPINAIPMFSQYNPKYMDPWSPYAPKRSVNDDNLRPIAGIGNVSLLQFEASRNYNSMQVAVRRSMSKGLFYGLAYTWSKTMAASASPYWPDKYRNYGASGVPHMLAVSYIYEVPNLGKTTGKKWLGWVTDHWTVSGITSWQGLGRASAPGCCSFTGTTAANPAPVMTGSAEGARMVVTRNATLPSDKVTFYNTFDWQAFRFPNPCSWAPGATPQQGVGQSMECFGNAGAGYLFTIPTRLNNWDATFAKSFPFFGERRALTFRAEMYNIFNHTQFSGINSTIQYDLANWQKGVLVQSNNQLGRYTSARDPRRMAMTLRFEF